MAVPTTITPPKRVSLDERLRNNIRVLKALWKITDQQIAERAKYSSRQQIADRLGGRTGFSALDVDRIASALRIDRDALLSPTDEMMRLAIAAQESEPAPPPRKRPAPRKQAAK